MEEMPQVVYLDENRHTIPISLPLPPSPLTGRSKPSGIFLQSLCEQSLQLVHTLLLLRPSLIEHSGIVQQQVNIREKIMNISVLLCLQFLLDMKENN